MFSSWHLEEISPYLACAFSSEMVKRSAELIKQGCTFGLDQMMRCCKQKAFCPKEGERGRKFLPLGQDGRMLKSSAHSGRVSLFSLPLLTKTLSLSEAGETSGSFRLWAFLSNLDFSVSSFSLELWCDWNLIWKQTASIGHCVYSMIHLVSLNLLLFNIDQLFYAEAVV